MPSSRLQSSRSWTQIAAPIQQAQPAPQAISMPPATLKARERREIWLGVTGVAAMRLASHPAQGEERAEIGRRAWPEALPPSSATRSPHDARKITLPAGGRRRNGALATRSPERGGPDQPRAPKASLSASSARIPALARRSHRAAAPDAPTARPARAASRATAPFTIVPLRQKRAPRISIWL